MDWLPALMGICGSVIAAFLTAHWAASRQRHQLREELKLAYAIETAIRHLLENPDYKKRSLGKIKRHLRGFESDDELRRYLVRAGAVAFGGDGDEELWGLLSRNRDEIR